MSRTVAGLRYNPSVVVLALTVAAWVALSLDYERQSISILDVPRSNAWWSGVAVGILVLVAAAAFFGFVADKPSVPWDEPDEPSNPRRAALFRAAGVLFGALCLSLSIWQLDVESSPAADQREVAGVLWYGSMLALVLVAPTTMMARAKTPARPVPLTRWIAFGWTMLAALTPTIITVAVATSRTSRSVVIGVIVGEAFVLAGRIGVREVRLPHTNEVVAPEVPVPRVSTEEPNHSSGRTTGPVAAALLAGALIAMLFGS